MIVQRVKSKGGTIGTYVSVGRNEALAIVRSLVTQIMENSPNSGRVEQYDTKGRYFSIFVESESE